MNGRSASKQIVVNTLTGWFAVVIRTAIALVMVPFLLSHLGTEGYGLIGLLGVIVGMTNVADLGLRAALGRELSEQVARNDPQAFNELASTALLLYFCIAFVLAIVCWLLAPWFVVFFKVPEALQADGILTIRIYGSASIMFSFITPVFSAALTSFHRFDVVNSVELFGGIVSGLMLYIVISAVDNPLFGWVIVMLIFQTLTLILTVLLFARFCDGAQLGVCFCNSERLHSLFRLGGQMYALQMTQTLAERSDPLVISYFFGPAGVALYQPGRRLSEMVRPIVLTLANQMYPITTKEHVNSRKDRIQTILVLGTKYTLLLGLLFSVGMLVFAEPFCRIWLGSTIGDDCLVVARVMQGWALVDLMTYAAGTQWAVLLGMKRLTFLVWSQLPAAVFNVLVSIYLVGFTKLGIPGVLVATIIVGVIRRPIVSWYTARACRLRFRTYIQEAYLRPFGCFLLTLFAGWSISHIVSVGGIAELLFSIAIVGLVWLVCTLGIGLTNRERYLILGFIKSTYGKIKGT
jgi:O-antigen/teichoic acid export membrane protein